MSLGEPHRERMIICEEQLQDATDSPLVAEFVCMGS